MSDMIKVRAILEDELVDWVEVKKWAILETSQEMAEYLLRAYSNRREAVEEDEKEEVKEEKKADKKPAKKSK